MNFKQSSPNKLLDVNLNWLLEISKNETMHIGYGTEVLLKCSKKKEHNKGSYLYVTEEMLTNKKFKLYCFSKKAHNQKKYIVQ